MERKFQVGQKIGYNRDGATRTGVIIECAAPGEKISGTSKGLESRYRIKWDNGAPRTWVRESALKLLSMLILIFILSSCTKETMQPAAAQVEKILAVPVKIYNVICTGNSLVHGGTLSSQDSYPAQLATFAPYDQPGSSVFNDGLNGNTTTQMLRYYQIDTVYAHYQDGAKNICIAWEIGNDIYFRGYTAQQAVNVFFQYADSVRAHGFKFYGLSLPYRNNYYLNGQIYSPGGDDSVSYEAKRIKVNQLLRMDRLHLDGLIDVASDSRLTSYDTTYYLPDHVHLTKTGYGAVVQDILKHGF